MADGVEVSIEVELTDFDEDDDARSEPRDSTARSSTQTPSWRG